MHKYRNFKQGDSGNKKHSNRSQTYQVKSDLLLNELISFLDGYTSGTTSFSEQL